MNQSYPMHAVVAKLVEDRYDIRFSYVEEHPAFSEGFTAYYSAFWQSNLSSPSNPHEQGTDGFYEWQDGYDMAECFSLVYTQNNKVKELLHG